MATGEREAQAGPITDSIFDRRKASRRYLKDDSAAASLAIVEVAAQRGGAV
jgi:hypothetical protein